jgi:hypothetical protein
MNTAVSFTKLVNTANERPKMLSPMNWLLQLNERDTLNSNLSLKAIK